MGQFGRDAQTVIACRESEEAVSWGMASRDPSQSAVCDNCGKDISDGSGVLMMDRKADGTPWNFAVCFECSPAMKEEMDRLEAEVEQRRHSPRSAADVNSPEAQELLRKLEQGE